MVHCNSNVRSTHEKVDQSSCCMPWMIPFWDVHIVQTLRWSHSFDNVVVTIGEFTTATALLVPVVVVSGNMCMNVHG